MKITRFCDEPSQRISRLEEEKKKFIDAMAKQYDKYVYAPALKHIQEDCGKRGHTFWKTTYYGEEITQVCKWCDVEVIVTRDQLR